MRLITYRSEESGPQVGLVTGERVVPLDAAWLQAFGDASTPPVGMVALIAALAARNRSASGETNSPIARAAEALAGGAGSLPLAGVQLEAPIMRPPKHVLCLGRNYAEHAAESTRAFGEAPPADKPAFPAIFTKAPTSITGPYADIEWDSKVSTQLDWEGELAIVIGMPGKNIAASAAMSHVFGYMVLNDISARDIQKRHGGQFFKGKSLDSACPMGPWIVSADKVLDPHALEITVRVNSAIKQHDYTGSMLFSIPEIIEHLSLGMTLEPGDVIATGTPAGVGHARTPPEFLVPGDVVECEIATVGLIRNRVVEVQR